MSRFIQRWLWPTSLLLVGLLIGGAAVSTMNASNPFAFLNDNVGAITAAFTVVLAISTIGLWLATQHLWEAAEQQIHVATRAADAARDAVVFARTSEADRLNRRAMLALLQLKKLQGVLRALNNELTAATSGDAVDIGPGRGAMIKGLVKEANALGPIPPTFDELLRSDGDVVVAGEVHLVFRWAAGSLAIPQMQTHEEIRSWIIERFIRLNGASAVIRMLDLLDKADSHFKAAAETFYADLVPKPDL